MNAEFNWWLLIVGLVVGGGLVWFVLLDSRRDEAAVAAEERRVEAAWIAAILAAEGEPLSAATTERVLDLHADYLATSGPPDPAAIHEPDPGPAADVGGTDDDSTDAGAPPA